MAFPQFPGTTSPQTNLWIITGDHIQPHPELLQKLCAWWSENVEHDVVYRFCFQEGTHPPHLFIHASKLKAVGGPLAAITQRDFVETNYKTVALCKEDHPPAFPVLRDYLYGNRFCLKDTPVHHIARIIRSAHRWQLYELVRVLCQYVLHRRLIQDSSSVQAFASVMHLPDLPHFLTSYFWRSAANCFDDFADSNFATFSFDAQLQQSKGIFSPHLPNLWHLALHYGNFSDFIFSILSRSLKDIAVQLLDVVLVYLEPKMEDDCYVLKLIEELAFNCALPMDLFQRSSISELCSKRALRLLAQALTRNVLEMKGIVYSWRVEPSKGTFLRDNCLLGSCKGAGNKEDYWRRGPFRVTGAVRFSVQAEMLTNEDLVIELRWAVGAEFSFVGKDIDVLLSVVHPGKFGVTEQRGNEEEEQCFVLAKVKHRSWLRKSMVHIAIPSKEWQKHKSTHDKGPPFKVVVCLNARVLDIHAPVKS